MLLVNFPFTNDREGEVSLIRGEDMKTKIMVFAAVVLIMGLFISNF
jgi:hypothetical protein